MTMRKVMVSRLVPQPHGRSYTSCALEPQGEALFHEFGMGCKESESGVGGHSTAIIEWPNGRVESVALDRIRFLTPSTLDVNDGKIVKPKVLEK